MGGARQGSRRLIYAAIGFVTFSKCALITRSCSRSGLSMTVPMGSQLRVFLTSVPTSRRVRAILRRHMATTPRQSDKAMAKSAKKPNRTRRRAIKTCGRLYSRWRKLVHPQARQSTCQSARHQNPARHTVPCRVAAPQCRRELKSALALARATDLIASVPERHTTLPARMPSRVRPFATAEFTVSLQWHPRLHADPAHRWLRNVVLETCGVEPPKGDGRIFVSVN